MASLSARHHLSRIHQPWPPGRASGAAWPSMYPQMGGLGRERRHRLDDDCRLHRHFQSHERTGHPPVRHRQGGRRQHADDGAGAVRVLVQQPVLDAPCLALPYGLGAGSIDAALNNYVALHYEARHMSWLHCFWGLGPRSGRTSWGLRFRAAAAAGRSGTRSSAASRRF